MNQSSTWKWILAIIVIILVIWGLSSWGGEPNPADEALSLDETTDLIINEPLADDVIESPLAISGEAIGSWYFEANFPIKLVNEDGEVLADSFATADGEWTTEELVPFNAEVEFDPAGAEKGYLLFGKDNPSGLPENELWVKMPVRFALADEVTDDESTDDEIIDDETTTTDDKTTDDAILEPKATAPSPSSQAAAPITLSATMPVKVFFSRAGNAETNCALVTATTRQVPRTVAIGRASLMELLKGPATAEIAQGLLTSLPSGVKLQALTINGGIARADFSAELNTGGSCRVTATRAQITETLKQFSTVSSVIISVNGDVAGALQP